MDPIVALSLFDGISCGQLALQRSGIPVSVYYASEIDKKATAVTTKNFPNTVHLGDVKNWKSWDFSEYGPPDLIIGGSPCQGFSHSGKGLNFKDPRSKLFFDFVDIINHFNPKYFLLENVGMRTEWEDIITKHMGVEPVKIDSALVSAAHRRRNYWTNIPGVSAPSDKNITISSILAPGAEVSPKGVSWNAGNIVGRKLNAQGKREDYNKNLKYTQCFQVRKDQEKFNCLTTVQKDTVLVALDPGRYPGAFTKYTKDIDWRYLSAEEAEQLMTLPLGYTSIKINNSFIAESSRHKMCGNAWTVDVISHIFGNIVNSTHTWNGTQWVLNTQPTDIADEFREFLKKSREEESKKNRNEKEAVIDQQLRELMGGDK